MRFVFSFLLFSVAFAADAAPLLPVKFTPAQERRVLDSIQLTAKHRVATPVNWKHGDDVIIAGSVSDDEAKTIYPEGWKAPKPYLRIVKQPK